MTRSIVVPVAAAVMLMSFMLAYWLSFGRRWTLGKAFQGLRILGAGLGGMYVAMSHIGVEGFDVDGVHNYMEAQSESAAGGGSAVEDVPVSVSGIPLALLNILFRPFPWEAHNLTALLAGVEIASFGGLMWYRRRNVLNAIRSWRSHALLRIAVPFVLVYAITLGMLVSNLGIIARQRIFLFPFLFVFLEVAPAYRRANSRREHPRQLARRSWGPHSHQPTS